MHIDEVIIGFRGWRSQGYLVGGTDFTKILRAKIYRDLTLRRQPLLVFDHDARKADAELAREQQFARNDSSQELLTFGEASTEA